VLRILSSGVVSQNASSGPRIRLVGQVSGRWVDELRRVCAEALDSDGMLVLDMQDVSFVDAEGLGLFRSLRGRRVQLLNCALFVAEQLKALEQDV
jgi:anti-anti-sigma regulatory factor